MTITNICEIPHRGAVIKTAGWCENVPFCAEEAARVPKLRVTAHHDMCAGSQGDAQKAPEFARGCSRPCGTRSSNPAFPALKRWATGRRSSRASAEILRAGTTSRHSCESAGGSKGVLTRMLEGRGKNSLKASFSRKLIGVLRLRGGCAARTSHSAQDDSHELRASIFHKTCRMMASRICASSGSR